MFGIFYFGNLNLCETHMGLVFQNYANKKGKINPARKLKQNVTGIQRLERNLAEVFPQSEIVAEMVEEVVKLYKKA